MHDADGLARVRGRKPPFLDELADVVAAKRALGGIESPPSPVMVVHRPIRRIDRWRLRLCGNCRSPVSTGGTCRDALDASRGAMRDRRQRTKEEQATIHDTIL